MAPHYCIYCLLSAQEWKVCNHEKGQPRTIKIINETVESNNITVQTKLNPRFQGVKAKPFWDFIPITKYCLSLLHIWIGVFNDIDNWFMQQVHDIVEWSPREHELRKEKAFLIAQIVIKAGFVEYFDKSEEGKNRKRLLTWSNKSKSNTQVGNVLPLSDEEKEQFKQLNSKRAKLASERDSLKEALKRANEQLSKLRSEIKRDCESYYHAIDNHWKSNGQSKGAYHGGQWNGKVARDVMTEPEKYYGTMHNIILQFKAESTTDEDVGLLLSNVIGLLSKWHAVFYLLRMKDRAPESSCDLAFKIADAVQKHRDLGLSVTPKVHIIEDHALQHFEDMPLSFFTVLKNL